MPNWVSVASVAESVTRKPNSNSTTLGSEMPLEVEKLLDKIIKQATLFQHDRSILTGWMQTAHGHVDNQKESVALPGTCWVAGLPDGGLEGRIQIEGALRMGQLAGTARSRAHWRRASTFSRMVTESG